MSSATEATTHEPSQAQRADSAALSAGAPSTSQATTPSTEISQAVMTHDTPSASGGHGRASPFPPSPALSPSSPRGYSGISSLAGSQQVGGDDELQAETQTLMQMLSMVGSRFLESERRGMLGNLAEVQSDEESDVEWAAQGSLDPTYQTDRNVQSFSSLGRTRLRYGMAGELLDDQATPRGGSTPMTSSLIGAPRPRAPLRRTLLSHSEHLTSKEPGAPLQAPSVCPNEVPASPSDHPDDENAGDDESEQGDGSEGRSLSGSCLSAAVAGSQATSSAAQSRRFPSAPSRAGTPTLLASFTESALAKDQERKRKLAKKLVDIFGLDESEEILAEHPCWIFRSILLQGFLYLTSGHLCFYAYLPTKEDRVLKSGTLTKRTRRTRRFSKHWAVLKGTALSWYESSRDPYFPQAHIDLRYALGVEPSSRHQERFKVKTTYRLFTFATDSEESRDEWVKALRKVLFRSQNEGESVKISIPLEAIIDVDSSSTVDNTDMVCVKVVDADADFAVDEYYFLHFADQPLFIETLRALVLDYERRTVSKSKQVVRDSTARTGSMSNLAQTTFRDIPVVEGLQQPDTKSRPHQLASSASEPVLETSESAAASLEESSHALAQPTDENAVPSESSARAFDPACLIADEKPTRSSQDSGRSVLTTTPKSETAGSVLHTYPPSPSFAPPPPLFDRVQREATRGWAVPRWVKTTPGRLLGTRPGSAGAAFSALMSTPPRKIREVWSASPMQADAEQQQAKEDLASSGHSNFSVMDKPEADQKTEVEQEIEAQFRASFAVPADETLISYVTGSLYRVLPVNGRVFVSDNFLCFRSSGLASKTVGRTLMMVPMRDIISAAKHNAFRFGQHGLVVIVRGHEEVFLEFASPERRDQCLSLVEAQVEAVRTPSHQPGAPSLSQDRTDALMLRDLGDRLDCSIDGSSSAQETPSVADESASSSFLTFRPEEPLHFTCLTIGSRGDVQPYIALAKGLRAEGHRVRIATHGEFRAWVEGHGIEFAEVGGDPAELMQICVENGTFTVSFLREGVTKFRGWLDDLLRSCWEACQGTDVIIESPSAIAGIHVAEALQVPYFRAFTMPWTRTRAYPHAFAVPGNKAGGNYNYMSYVIFDQVFWRASAGQINRWRKRCLGLHSTSLDKLEQHKVPFLYNFSPSLVPRPLDWYEWIYVTGFWFLDNPDNSESKKWQPPPELVAFIQRARANGRKLVYIGWGSIVVSDAEAMTRCVIEAVRLSGVCAILSKGWSDRLSSKGESSDTTVFPEDIHPVNSVPHDWLFPLIDAACHHGGAGTLGASLRAGIPTIVKPYFGDQFFWGNQVESLGVGSCVRKLTAENLAEALRTATLNTKQIERAKLLGAQIRSEEGVGNAIKAIYRDLDYARSLIKRDTRLQTQTAPPVAEHATEEEQTVEASPAAPPEVSLPDAGGAAASTIAGVAPMRQPSAQGSVHSSDHASDEWSVISGSEDDAAAIWSRAASIGGDDPTSPLASPR